MTRAEPLGLLRQELERYLEDSFGAYEVDADGDLLVRRGSAVTYLRPAEWTDGQTVVRIWAITNVGVRVDGELTRFLATESGKFVFGGFHLDESVPAVVFAHTLLGDFLSRQELEEAVGAVAETADVYDDRIKARFGGRLAGEPAALVTPPATGKRALQAIFGILGAAVGVLAAVGSYYWIASSIALSVYAFLLASYLVGRGVADLVTDPHKLRRALYFALQPVLGTAVLYGSHRLWGHWWLAALLGVLGGGLLAGVVGPIFFPRIHREELADTAQRMTEGLRS